MTRVLVVDDEPQILRALRINLRVREYQVDVAATGTEALEMAARHPPDLVILDLGLPDLDGVEVIQGLRGWTKAPIIVLSGRADSVNKVEALDAGADDYITKPFGVEELLARMRAAVRRTGAAEDQPRIRLGDLIVDYRGSYILSFAGYNAGRGRVRDWVERFGDPRDPNVDPIDWVERIPFSETRNYVQRVIENMQLYRARMSNDSRLLIEADLRRGG